MTARVTITEDVIRSRAPMTIDAARALAGYIRRKDLIWEMYRYPALRPYLFEPIPDHAMSDVVALINACAAKRAERTPARVSTGRSGAISSANRIHHSTSDNPMARYQKPDIPYDPMGGFSTD